MKVPNYLDTTSHSFSIDSVVLLCYAVPSKNGYKKPRKCQKKNCAGR